MVQLAHHSHFTAGDLERFMGLSIGFDSMFNRLMHSPSEQNTGYPPYNIAKINEDEFMISIAVAGFGMDNLKIEKDKNVLTIEGTQPKGTEEVNYVHRGIAGRNFSRQFTLAEHVDVTSAKLEKGMLNIHLTREVPEALKPKTIDIVEAE